MVQLLRRHIFNAGDLGSAPGQGTRSCLPQLKILHAAIETQCSQINFFLEKQTDQVTEVHEKY